VRAILALLLLGLLHSSTPAQESAPPGPAAGKKAVAGAQAKAPESTPLERALKQAEANRGQLELALQRVPAEQKAGMEFLIAHMPVQDLLSLKAEFLLQNVDLAYQTRQEGFAKYLPEEVFFNAVLPYAQVNEKREAWRPDFRARFLPLVEGCKTAGEAALRLNEQIFGLVNVKYSTQRKKPDQSPSESMEIGLASCTGLSILLADACRSVGVPARLAGTANWFDKRGNHTWVEVWDDGGWHFLGAAEPDKRGLDHGWFAGDAARAVPGSREHAIYAATWASTSNSLPMVWAPEIDWVPAVDVTTRYLPKGSKAKVDAVASADGKTVLAKQGIVLLIDLRPAEGKPRVAAKVRVRDAQNREILAEGMTRDESHDANDYFMATLPGAGNYLIEVDLPHSIHLQSYRGSAEARQIVHLQASDKDQDLATRTADRWFAASDQERASMEIPVELDRQLMTEEDGLRELVWRSYQNAPIHSSARADFDAHRVRNGEHESPYTLKKVGKMPAGGWPLFIAMHGGGGAPQELNDSQWKHMQIYYRDQTDLEGGYLYLALRAPNNSWNGFYTGYVYPLMENLVRQMALYAGVNTDKVFLMGYSHGGYGAFAIGPQIPYRFAAVHASAAAPTPSETAAENLRNTVFTFMIGELDTAYGRADRCKEFNQLIQKLRGERKDIYPVTMQWKPGFKHGGLPDRDKIREMYGHRRNPVPGELSWRMTNDVVHDFYWLHASTPSPGGKVMAIHKDQIFTFTDLKEGLGLRLCLDARLIDFRHPLELMIDGVERSVDIRPSFRTLLESIIERGDPKLAYTCAVPL
jgi:pimeloyl-ACP methyl ester carboxylesterase